MKNLREQAVEATAELRKAFPVWAAPVAMVQMGIGFDLEGLVDRELGTVPLDSLPGMPSAAGPGGRALKLTLGECGKVQVLLAHGRYHLYEGWGMAPCVLPVCAAAMCGVRNFVLLSTCGAIREELKPGTWVFLTDYINNLGTSPLVGNLDLENDCVREMTETFSQALISELSNAAARVGLTPRMGIYQANLGPQFETRAEVEIARRNGADVIGATIVAESIVAHAMGGKVAAAVLVTHPAAGHCFKPVSQARIDEESRYCSPLIVRALRLFLTEGISSSV